MRDAISVVPVSGRKRMRDFLRLPNALYRNDPNWVSPLLAERRAHFSKKRNAFFQHAEAAYWLALRDSKPVGRITAQVDSLHLAQHRDATGHFGFVEGIDDPAVFAALLDTAEAWLKGQGMRRCVGPVSFSMWDEPGLLVEGFDRPPNVLMGHALPYYERLIAGRGYAAVQDLLAYEYPIHQAAPENVQRLIDRARQRREFRFRPIRDGRRHLQSELEVIRDILNDAWRDNWGFVPMTRAEIDDIVGMFRLLLPPEAIVIGEYNGEPVGFALMLPNVNEWLADLDGRLFPLGWLKLLWRLKMGGARSGRLALLGVRRQWWNSPVGAIVALLCIHEAKVSAYARRGDHAELSWVLDSNERIKKVLALFGAKVVKRYRIFEKPIV